MFEVERERPQYIVINECEREKNRVEANKKSCKFEKKHIEKKIQK